MNFVDAILREHMGTLELERYGIGQTWASVLLTPQFVTSRHIVALVFAAGAANPGVVVKIPRRPGDNEGVRREAAMLRHLAAAGQLGVAGIPEVVAMLDVGAHTVLIETALAGRVLDPESVAADLPGAVQAGADFAARLPCTLAAPANTGWYSRTISAPLLRLAGLLPGDEEVALMVERTHELLEPLAGVALPAVFEHGDLSHPNLFLAADGTLQVVDWERSTPEGLPGHDLVFYLQYLAESAAGAFIRQRQVAAFDHAFGPSGWALEPLRRHLTTRGVDLGLLHPLILATWARSAATLADRLGEGTDARQTQQAIRAAVSGDRDFWLWRHLVTSGLP